MGDQDLTLSLPPGCRFYPSELHLLRYYLTPKTNLDRRFKFDLITNLDLYRYNPFDLPDTACFLYGRGGRRRHWYCYVAVEERGRSRAAGGGYWRRRGREKDVVGDGAGKVVVGTRKSFVFYLGNSDKSAVRTDWVMYEYALLDRHKVSFVLCRVLVKLNRRCKGSDHVPSSCGEQSFSTVRDIGIQHDGNKTSCVRETVVQDDDSVDKKDEALQVKVGPARGVDDQINAGEVALAGVELLPQEQVMVSISEEDYIELDDLTEQLVSFLDDDYIELDDLYSPLSGIDFT